MLHQEHHLADELGNGVGLGTVDGDLVAPHVHQGGGKRCLDDPQVLVALAEQGGHEVVAGHGDLDRGRLHGGLHRLVAACTAAPLERTVFGDPNSPWSP